MGRHFLAVLTVTLGIALPATAQTALLTAAPSPPERQATREDVVARLMAFDLNHDGRLARVELPERMHHLLTRGDVDKDQTLDSIETFRLSEQPTKVAAVRGLQPGRYGFGEGSFFDSRLHIEGAIEDLRLAGNDREKALGIARRFSEAREESTKSDLLDTMEQILTTGSLEDFKAVLDRQATANVRVLPGTAGTVVNANPDAAAVALRMQQMVLRLNTGNLPRVIDKYGLQPAEQQRALAAIERYNEARSGRLNEVDRTALLEQLQALLDDEQLDDLRAALERRPIVKQNVGFVVRGGVFPAQGEGQIHKLVLKD